MAPYRGPKVVAWPPPMKSPGLELAWALVQETEVVVVVVVVVVVYRWRPTAAAQCPTWLSA